MKKPVRTMTYKYFENRNCEYYPCHKGSGHINCLFCFCPLYRLDCGGNYTYTKGVKDCSNCLFPHVEQNYDKVIEKLVADRGKPPVPDGSN